MSFVASLLREELQFPWWALASLWQSKKACVAQRTLKGREVGWTRVFHAAPLSPAASSA